MSVTEKNTKREILKAYEAAMVNIQVANSEKASLRDQVSKANDEQVIEKAGTLNSLAMAGGIHELGERVRETWNNLHTVDKAIDLKKQELQDVHGIIAEADSLAALMDVQKSATDAANLKASQDQNKHREMMVGLSTEASKSLQTIKEEYAKKTVDLEYAFNRKATILTDEFQDKSKKCNREIYEKETAADSAFKMREEILIRGEEKAKLLIAKVEAFPDVVIEAEVRATAQAIEKAANDHAHAIATAQAEMTHLTEKHDTITDTLKVKLASSLEEIVYLKTQLEVQSAKVNDIATKAIDGAARTVVSAPFQTPGNFTNNGPSPRS